MTYYVLLKSIRGQTSHGITLTELYEVFTSSFHDDNVTQAILNTKSSVSIQNINRPTSWSASGRDLLLLTGPDIKSPENVELFKTLEFSMDDTERPSQPELTAYVTIKVMENRLHNLQNPDNILPLSEEEMFAYLQEKCNTTKTTVDYKAIITNYFGEDRVEFPNSDTFIVFFPKSDLQNSSGRQHTIYNTYLKCKIHIADGVSILTHRFNLSNSFVDKVQKLTTCGTRLILSAGTRTLVSSDEHNANYFFSHFSRTRHGWVGCCLGYGILSDYAQKITIETEEQVFGFCLALENYLKWESLEGGPYIKMSDITSSAPRNESFNLSSFQATMFSSLVNNTDNIISNIDSSLLVKLNESKLDEINCHFGLKQGSAVSYLPEAKLRSNVKEKKTVSLPSRTHGDDFFKFKGQNVGRVYIDNSLNKNSVQQVLSGELVKYRNYYSTITSTIQTLITKIINDNPSKYLEKKPTFNIS
jgi:hypothetical protein